MSSTCSTISPSVRWVLRGLRSLCFQTITERSTILGVQVVWKWRGVTLYTIDLSLEFRHEERPGVFQLLLSLHRFHRFAISRNITSSFPPSFLLSLPLLSSHLLSFFFLLPLTLCPSFCLPSSLLRKRL